MCSQLKLCHSDLDIKPSLGHIAFTIIPIVMKLCILMFLGEGMCSQPISGHPDLDLCPLLQKNVFWAILPLLYALYFIVVMKLCMLTCVKKKVCSLSKLSQSDLDL